LPESEKILNYELFINTIHVIDILNFVTYMDMRV